MAKQVVGGITYYRFGSSLWATVDTSTTPATLRPLANTPVTLYGDETTSTPLSVLGTNLLPLANPTNTNTNGERGDFYAAQFDTVFGDAGQGRKPIVCLDLAEAIVDVRAGAAADAQAALESRIASLEASRLSAADKTKLDTFDLSGAAPDARLAYDANTSKIKFSATGGPFALESHEHPKAVIFLADGVQPPAGTPADTLIARTGAGPAFGYGAEVGRATGTAVTTTGLTITAASALAIGDTVVIGVGASGTGGVIADWTVTAGTNTFTTAQKHIQGTSAQSALLVCKLTQAIAAGGTIVVKPNATLDDMVVIASSVLGAATNPVDQVMTNGSGTATTLSVGPTATTTVSDEVAFAALVWLPGEPETRTFTPTSGTTQVGATGKNTDTTPRALALVYRTLTTTQTVTLSGTISGTASVFSGSLATIKKA